MTEHIESEVGTYARSQDELKTQTEQFHLATHSISLLLPFFFVAFLLSLFLS